MYILKYCCISNVGKLRNDNQDNFLCGEAINPVNTLHSLIQKDIVLKEPYFVGIFDGMGGEQNGEMAAYISAETALNFQFKENSSEEILKYCQMANENVCNYAVQNKLTATGTTVAAMLFSKDKAHMLNIGDSKVFTYIKDRLEHISVDDSFISLQGKKAPLSQCIGMKEEECKIIPHIKPIKMEPGIRFVICSDGITDMVNNDSISEILSKYTNVADAAHNLIKQAMDNGGKDNATVIVAEIKKSHLWNWRIKNG